MTPSFDCDRALDEIQSWLNGESTPEHAAALEAHLAVCHECSSHRDFEVRFRAVLARATREGACPPELRARLLTELRREQGKD